MPCASSRADCRELSRLTRSVAFLSKLLSSDEEIRFVDLPAIEGATGKFLLHQMASVAELEAGVISDRTKKALAAARPGVSNLGGSAAGLDRLMTALGRAVLAY
jgi:DNA invertase Pin-like site-specific DNA recombinase